MVSRSFDVCVQNMLLVLGSESEPRGRLKRRGYTLIVCIVYDKVGSATTIKVWFARPWGGAAWVSANR